MPIIPSAALPSGTQTGGGGGADGAVATSGSYTGGPFAPVGPLLARPSLRTGTVDNLIARVLEHDNCGQMMPAVIGDNARCKAYNRPGIQGNGTVETFLNRIRYMGSRGYMAPRTSTVPPVLVPPAYNGVTPLDYRTVRTVMVHSNARAAGAAAASFTATWRSPRAAAADIERQCAPPAAAGIAPLEQAPVLVPAVIFHFRPSSGSATQSGATTIEGVAYASGAPYPVGGRVSVVLNLTYTPVDFSGELTESLALDLFCVDAGRPAVVVWFPSAPGAYGPVYCPLAVGLIETPSFSVVPSGTTIDFTVECTSPGLDIFTSLGAAFKDSYSYCEVEFLDVRNGGESIACTDGKDSRSWY